MSACFSKVTRKSWSYTIRNKGIRNTRENYKKSYFYCHWKMS